MSYFLAVFSFPVNRHLVLRWVGWLPPGNICPLNSFQENRTHSGHFEQGGKKCRKCFPRTVNSDFIWRKAGQGMGIGLRELEYPAGWKEARGSGRGMWVGGLALVSTCWEPQRGKDHEWTQAYDQSLGSEGCPVPATGLSTICC